MTRFVFAAIALTAMLSIVACKPAPVGVRDIELPTDATQQCVSLCDQVGLGLQSLVIMANNVGCVCAPAGDALRPSDTSAAGASAGGMAAIMIAEEAARQSQQQQPQSSQPGPGHQR